MKRIMLLSLGWACVGLAFIGIFVPGIPTTPFLIVALWAFAQSSKKFHAWLLNHKRFGPILQNWESHRVVPRKAKTLMVILQIFAVIMFHFSIQNIYLTGILAITLIIVARWVLTFPSELPVDEK
tara:strand:- start:409 stop:783 length:375 start_codon:yes stop_codon:yes gene_type:complete